MLEKGLTFIPTVLNNNKTELFRDLHAYHRRLKLLDFFNFEMEDNVDPFQEPSTWEPPVDLISADILSLIKKDQRALSRGRWESPPSNLTNPQLQALKNLSRRSGIIIKPADKGSQLVIQDRANYLQEAHRQLQNSEHYAKLDHSLQLQTQEMMLPILIQLCEGEYITKKQLKFFSGPDIPKPRFNRQFNTAIAYLQQT